MPRVELLRPLASLIQPSKPSFYENQFLTDVFLTGISGFDLFIQE